MSTSPKRFKINPTEVVHEEIDGEVIAIDLGRGSYFTMSGGAADVWSMLEGGATQEEITAAFTTDSAADGLELEVQDLLARLETEVLIVAADNGGGDPPPGGSVAYRPLVFEKYEDLQDYFKLDPIHEVGSAGWPKPADA